MKTSELTAMATFFARLTDLRDYLAGIRAALAQHQTCDCEIGTNGLYRLAGRCRPTAGSDRLPDMCLTVGHLAARIQLETLQLPVAHLSDPQLDRVIDQLADLVQSAPDLTQRRFVIELQKTLRASLLGLAQPTTDSPTPPPAPVHDQPGDD